MKLSFLGIWELPCKIGRVLFVWALLPLPPGSVRVSAGFPVPMNKQCTAPFLVVRLFVFVQNLQKSTKFVTWNTTKVPFHFTGLFIQCNNDYDKTFSPVNTHWYPLNLPWDQVIVAVALCNLLLALTAITVVRAKNNFPSDCTLGLKHYLEFAKNRTGSYQNRARPCVRRRFPWTGLPCPSPPTGSPSPPSGCQRKGWTGSKT